MIEESAKRRGGRRREHAIDGVAAPSETPPRAGDVDGLDAATREWLKLNKLPLCALISIAHGHRPMHKIAPGLFKDGQVQRLKEAVRDGVLVPAVPADRAEPTSRTRVTLDAFAAYVAQVADPAFKALLDRVLGLWQAVRSTLPPEPAATTEANAEPPRSDRRKRRNVRSYAGDDAPHVADMRQRIAAARAAGETLFPYPAALAVIADAEGTTNPVKGNCAPQSKAMRLVRRYNATPDLASVERTERD